MAADNKAVDEEEQAEELEEVEEHEEVEDEEMEEVDPDAEEETQEEGETEDVAATAKATAGADVNVNSFEELRLSAAVCDASQDAWRAFINMAASREAAGEAIYAALFDAAPSLQSLFTTPRAIQSMKFMNGLNQFIMGLSDPAGLKVAVETLGFGHLALDVTIPRVVIFRDAILDLLQVELGSKMTTEAYTGWRAMLNYVGGAIIYIKAFYADRIRLLGESWNLCSGRNVKNAEDATEHAAEEVKKAEEMSDKSKKKKDKNEHDKEHAGGDDQKGNNTSMVENIPTTFPQMFQFNAAVMGFGTSMWMNEVLACFDNIVSNVANSGRLVEECDVLVCRIAKVSTGKVNLAEFKSCMLASLRSLLPKDWTTAHEVAWSWLWENVEKLIQKNMGFPPKWEKAYAKLLDSIDEATGFQLRKDIYLKFFALSPAGQNYFKQSNTYLHLIATKVLVMVIDIYKDPVRMVDDISALGLRHVGYAIPTEYMPPFASACVEVVQGLTKDQDCIDGFQWSIGLIAKSLVRTILEGSTIVMKAINTNTKRSLNKAIGVAPRGERANWLLLIQVGTQTISPLAWSLESGAVESASAMLNDLLVIRADRDKYYYAVDDLFGRHWDVVKMLCDNAPVLLAELFSGLIWRSRNTTNGMRRVNYYIQHLLVGPDGKFAKTLEWIAKAEDPRIVCHPTLTLLADTIWNGIACRSFLFRKSWFLFTLSIFIVSQAVLNHINQGSAGEIQRVTTFSFRAFIYVFSMGQMLFAHISRTIKGYRRGNTLKLFGKVPIPAYLSNWQDSANLILMLELMVMLASEPVFHCLQDNGGELFTEICEGSSGVRVFPYSVFSMLAMILYFLLLVDLAVMNNKVSAFVLVCGRMISEVGLFLLSLACILLTFSSAFSCLFNNVDHFKQGIHVGVFSLFKMVMNMYSAENYDKLDGEPFILLGTIVFLIISVVFLLNMLIAQLACAYNAIYQDMVGYARLKRIKIIVETMVGMSDKRWGRFTKTLGLEHRLEFNEGDIGLAGGVQVLEPANANPTTVDMINRYGGSTSPSQPWNETEGVAGDDESDKFERLEKLIQRAMAQVTKTGKKSGKHSKGGSSLGASGSGDGGGSGNHEDDGGGSGGADDHDAEED